VEMQVWPPASLGRRRGRGAAAPVPQLDVCGREKKKEERGGEERSGPNNQRERERGVEVREDRKSRGFLVKLLRIC